ncbi:acyltransferase family protein [Streptomyces netropsis]|uniref:acyltransferase family protein n=1 Tax=Streptomyces netropsis TaxID=55404 RepID=UPI0037B00EA9
MGCAQHGGRLRRSSSPGRIHGLDGLRLLAALMVMVYHYAALYGGWGRHPRSVFPCLYTVARYGWLGVEIFFMISGFAICLSTWGRSLGEFAVSRISRIYPAYWIAVLLTASVVVTWPQVRRVSDWEAIPVNLTIVQEALGVANVDGVYWTLFMELKFYLLFATVAAFGITYRKCILFCGVWLFTGLIGVVDGPEALGAWAMPGFAPYFVAGIAFSLIHRFGPNILLWGIAVFSFILAEHGLGERLADNRDAGHAMPAWPAQVAVLAAFAIIAVMALGRLSTIRWRWLAPAGALTYPLYLIHQHIGMTLIYALRDRLPALALVLGITVLMLGVSWVLHRWCERPLASWLRKALQRSVEEVRCGAHKAVAARPLALPPYGVKAAPEGCADHSPQVRDSTDQCAESLRAVDCQASRECMIQSHSRCTISASTGNSSGAHCRLAEFLCGVPQRTRP